MRWWLRGLLVAALAVCCWVPRSAGAQRGRAPPAGGAARPPRTVGDAGALQGDAGALQGDAGALLGDAGAKEGDAGALLGDAGAKEGDAGAKEGGAGAPGGYRIVCEDGVCRLVSAPAEGDAPGHQLTQGDAVAPSFFEGYTVVANGMGERSPEEMVALLEGREPTQRRGLWQSLLVALLGGVLLNLTPCVLPLVPITLMILGAKTGGRRRGALLGGAYGLGIAVAYGALGAASLALGTAFGTVQSSPWFNAVVAVVMVALSLAMFGVYAVDFARYRKRGESRGTGVAAAFGAGIGFALLAGACVAPVVLETLLYAATAGGALAWALPFALGVGMGAPWALLGAGLARLPKPGAWMRWVERAFGVVAVVMAVHYARLAWNGFAGRQVAQTPLSQFSDPEAAMDEARREGKPVFVDLWATWCRSCEALERGTMRDPRVAKALEGAVVLRLQCEDPNDPSSVALFEELGFATVRGLPAYALLTPREPSK